MVIGERLRQLREAKGLSQTDILKRAGLMRCYTSRVEHGHTIPDVSTLQKYAAALEVPLYRFFYDGEVPPKTPKLPTQRDKMDARLAGHQLHGSKKPGVMQVASGW